MRCVHLTFMYTGTSKNNLGVVSPVANFTLITKLVSFLKRFLFNKKIALLN